MTTEAEKVRAARDQAKAFAQLHREQLAREWMQWMDTAILCHGKMRELAVICEVLDRANSLRIAESFAFRAAFEFTAGNGNV